MHTRTMFDFSEGDQQEGWVVINDGVMGGVSTSSFDVTGDGTALFKGTVSLENNGGFASVRSQPELHDLAGYSGLRLQVRGDGKNYQLRLRTNDRFDGVAYQATFATTETEWTNIDIPFTSLQPTFRGRRVPDATPFDPATIRQIGFLIADGQEGDFALELRSVHAYR